MPSFRILGTLLAGSDEIILKLIEAGVLKTLLQAVDHQKAQVRVEVFWALSNVTASTSEILQMCIDLGLIESALRHFC